MPLAPLEQYIALQLGGLAFFVSLAVAGFARLGGLGDTPDARSSHQRTTPTAGGLGIVAGVGAAVLVAALLHASTVFVQPGSAAKLASVLACAFALGVLGLIDDRVVVSTGLKFGLIALISAYAVLSVGAVTMLPYGNDHQYLLWWSGAAGTVLWVFVVTNAVNFMDGINGLMGGSMAVASGGLCVVAMHVDAPVTAVLSGVLSAGLLGFLPYNLRSRAAAFCGDCGSLPVGFLYAASVLLLVHEQPELRLLYAGPLLIMPLLADVLLTLVRKPFKGIGLTAPHNTHIYQRLARSIGQHLAVTALYVGAVAIMVVLVNHAVERGTLGSMAGLGLVSGVFACLYAALSASLPD